MFNSCRHHEEDQKFNHISTWTISYISSEGNTQESASITIPLLKVKSTHHMKQLNFTTVYSIKCTVKAAGNDQRTLCAGKTILHGLKPNPTRKCFD